MSDEVEVIEDSSSEIVGSGNTLDTVEETDSVKR